VAKADQTLGAALQDRRTALGLSQAEAARQMGTTQGNLSRWERDLTEPRDVDAYELVAEFLGISLRSMAGLLAESARVRVLREIADHLG